MSSLALWVYLLVLSAPDAGLPSQPLGGRILTPLAKLPSSPTLDLSSLDRSVDPCTDFFHFSCGGWLKANPIPPDQASWSVYAKAEETNQRLLWGLLEAAAKAEHRTPAQAKVGDAWAACMDEEGVEQLGDAPLKAELAKLEAIESAAELPGWLAQASASGGATLFGFDADQDFQDAAHYVAVTAAGGLGLPDRDQYFPKNAAGKKTLEKYRAFVSSMLALLGEPVEQARADTETVMRIETALAKASLTTTERRDPYQIHHKLELGALQALTPAFRWDAFLAASTSKKIEVLDVTQPGFFKALQRVLATEPLSGLKRYLAYRTVRARADLLPRRFVDARFDFYGRVLGGATQLRPRWKRCIDRIDGELPHALGQLYVEQALPPETKPATQEMIRQIEAVMEQRIKALDWMSEETKRKALEKLHAMRNKVGYPDRWHDYSTLEVKRGDLYGNSARASLFETERRLRRLGGPLERDEWEMSAPTVNAYYNSQMNDMNFPAGVLQPPLFDVKADAAPNYGNTGSTIGHELTHGFDDEGRQFDADGNLKDWWGQKDGAQFNARAKCVQDQYAQYIVVDRLRINTKLTVGEDVADLGGTLIAYEAWKQSVKEQPLASIDGFTPEQRFFIGFAQWACGETRPERERVNALTNPHSPLSARINGVVVNMPEFGRAFACKADAPLLKAKPCKVW